ncbi:thioredoxin domain-containing protein [Antrihabitans spumae]|uniref:Thioredoxin domain-containing protein n=1 Tax=Antrihabitans spumae TaxID=3373370 RepID=A0ABW7JVK3_9NOCA
MNAKPKAKASSKYTPKPTSSTPTYILGGIALVVIAIVVIGGVIWQNNRDKPRNEGYGTVNNAAVQVQIQDEGAVRLGRPDAAVTVDLFEDAMCPGCQQFEHLFGQEMAQAVDDGKLAIRYHMLDGLNQLSASGDYSTRAAAATRCVAETGNAIAYNKFHVALYADENKPEEKGKTDLSNEQLAQLAKDSGVADAGVQCIASGAKAQEAADGANESREVMAAAGAKVTPTALLDGKIVDTAKADWIEKLG